MTGSGDGRGPGTRQRAQCGQGAFLGARAALGIILVAGLVAGCSQSSRSTRLAQTMTPWSTETLGVPASPRVVATTDSKGRALPKGGGVRKVGKPYQVAGRWYTPKEDPTYDEVGVASWYGHDFHGRKTANGEIYDMNALTAAHKTLPLPSFAYVTNVKNNRTVLVRVNDRGPFARNRVIDLSRATARALGLEAAGVGRVRVQYAGPAPLNGNDYHERKFLSAQSWARSDRLAFHQSGPQSRPPHREPSPKSYASNQRTGWSYEGYRRSLGR